MILLMLVMMGSNKLYRPFLNMEIQDGDHPRIFILPIDPKL